MMDNADTQTNRWNERPWAARVVRVAVYAVPLALSIVTSIILTSILAAPMSVTWSVLRWVSIVAVSTAVLIGTERISRRLLPLATLFKLSLAFPDRVPSRFSIALRIGTTAQLRQRIEAAQRGEIADSPGEAAEQLLELVGLLSHHDRLTRGHSERVRAYTHLVGVEMGISGESLDRLRWSALLHDVGKITIPGAILNKPGRLTDDEFDTIKTHPLAGKKLVEPLSDWLGESVRAVWEHHERFDGGGYPSGLAGSDISLAARIVCVTDAFDVMTSARSYKQPMTAAAARAELSRCAGSQFDPTVVRAFVAASIGTTQTATKPLTFLAQLFLFPRTFLANASAVLGVTAAVAAGTVAGAVGQTVAADRPASVPREVPADEAGLSGSEGPRASETNPVVVVTSLSDRDNPDGPTTSVSGDDPDNPLLPTSEPDGTRSGGTNPDGSGSDGTSQDDTSPDGTTLPPKRVPGGTIPGVTMPPATTPDTTTPGLTIPTTLVPVVTVPSITVPVITVPVITVPVITVPVITVPVITVPVVTVSLPEVVISVPPITLPPITVPSVTVPPVTVPPVTVPAVTVPAVTVPPVTVPPVTFPPVTGPGGLF